jgi:hypothetical protein
MVAAVAHAGEPPAVGKIREGFLFDIAKKGGDPKRCRVDWHEELGVFSWECSDAPYRCYGAVRPDGQPLPFPLLGCEERAPGSSKERKL